MPITATVTTIDQNPDAIAVTFTRSDDVVERIAVDPSSSPADIIQAISDRLGQLNAVQQSDYQTLIGTQVT